MSSLVKDWRIRHILGIGFILSGYAFILILGTTIGNRHFTPCIFKNLTGLPCPGCGMGRATIAFFHGDLMQSFFINPAAIPFAIAMLISLIWMIYDLHLGTTNFFSTINKKLPAKYMILLITLVCVNWAWSVVKGV